MFTRSRIILHSCCVLLVLMATAPQLFAKGVAAIKERANHRDSSALLVVYDKMDRRGPYVRLYKAGQLIASYPASRPIEFGVDAIF